MVTHCTSLPFHWGNEAEGVYYSFDRTVSLLFFFSFFFYAFN